MKHTKQITYEQWLYILAFGLALGVRLLNLGEAPLSDFEAGWAIQSWKAVQGKPLEIGPNPGYFSLTTLVFYLLDSNNSLARLWPVLFGSLAVLTTWGFRREFGRVPALLIAFGLAMDPGLVAVSRLAGGPMIAIGAVLLVLALIYARKPVWAGILAGLALISGPWVWTGLFGLLIASGLGWLGGFLPVFLRPDQEYPIGSETAAQDRIQTPLIVTGFTILAVSTLFFYYPGGLGAWGGAFAQYFQGWILPSGIPFLRPVLAVVVYQPLVLIAAGVTAVRGWLQGDIPTIRWLSVWALVALSLSLIYPGRQVFDVVWALVPLWILAALEFARYLRKPTYPSIAFGQAGVIVVLAILFWLVGLNIIPESNIWVILVSLPLLILVTSLLVGLGWSSDTSRSGFAWGIGVSFGLYSMAAMFGVSQIQPNSPRELWAPYPAAVQTSLMAETLSELALIQNGRVDWIDIVSTVESPTLQWVLRDFSDVNYVSMLGADTLPTVIITPKETDGSENLDLSQTMAYRGQDFLWQAYPSWSGALPPQVWEWITRRQAPIDYKSIILWARSDLFPEQAEEESEISVSAPLENSEEVH